MRWASGCGSGGPGCQVRWSGEIRAKLKTAPSVINHLPVAGVWARAWGPGIHQRGQGLTYRKMSSTLTRQGISEPNVTESLSMRGPFKRDNRDVKMCAYIYLCSDSDSRLGTPIARIPRGAECVFACLSLTHTPRQRRWGGVIRLRMINAPFCQPWHLEHICPAGTRAYMLRASGIKLPFISSPEAEGKGSSSCRQNLPPPTKPSRTAQSGPTLELSTLSGDDIYDVEMACYLFSVQTMWRWFIVVVPQTPPFLSLSLFRFKSFLFLDFVPFSSHLSASITLSRLYIFPHIHYQKY